MSQKEVQDMVKKVQHGLWKEPKLLTAVRLVIELCCYMREAVRKTGVPKTTLLRYVELVRDGVVSLPPQNIPPANGPVIFPITVMAVSLLHSKKGRWAAHRFSMKLKRRFLWSEFCTIRRFSCQ